MMHSEDISAVGPRNASRIWGFVSKFVMLDRFAKTLGLAEIHKAPPVRRTVCEEEYFGTAAKVRIFST